MLHFYLSSVIVWVLILFACKHVNTVLGNPIKKNGWMEKSKPTTAPQRLFNTIVVAAIPFFRLVAVLVMIWMMQKKSEE